MIVSFTIPETLDEAVLSLYDSLDDYDRDFLNKEIQYRDVNGILTLLHHNLGQGIRNTWGLWQDSILARFFKETYGLGHADDMSSIIIKKFLSDYFDKIYDIEADVEHYKKYWISYNVDPLTQKEIS